MADLTIYLNEKITLDGNDRGVLTTQTIPGINNIDNRILNIPTGSYTPLFYFNPSSVDAGTFSTSRSARAERASGDFQTVETIETIEAQRAERSSRQGRTPDG